MLAAAEAVLAGVTPTVEAIETATGISRGASANALARMEEVRAVASVAGNERQGIGPGLSSTTMPSSTGTQRLQQCFVSRNV